MSAVMSYEQSLVMPQDMAGLVAAVQTIADQDAVIGEALRLLTALERRLQQDAEDERWTQVCDVRAAIRSAMAARARVRPLMWQLGYA